MLSLEQISDRLEIQDLCWRYAQAVDTKNFDDFREVFTADAFIDYTCFGGISGDLETVIAWLKEVFAPEIHPNHQHLTANLQISVAGDEARGRIMCFNPQEAGPALTGRAGTQVYFCGLWYIDEYRRTREGWRISRRVEEKSFTFNHPREAAAPP